jgi:phosphoribosylanthranilate isomerase
MRVAVKICGIAALEDALAAVEAGADALGFMCWPGSPRRVDLRRAGEIVRRLPPFVARVGVFVDQDETFIREAVAACGFDTLQFHGSESPEFCRRFAPLAVIKGFRLRGAESLDGLAAYATNAWLLDTYVPGQMGGTGARFDWDLAVRAAARGVPVVVAGGLTPENVGDAIRQTRPYGVDVASGVEDRPGHKNAAKVRAFVAAAREASGAPAGSPPRGGAPPRATP